MRGFLIASAAAVTVIASAALAVQTNAPPSRGKDRAQLVCSTEAKTGSRFGRRSCITHTERDARREQNKKDAAEMIDRPVHNPVCSGSDC